MNYQNIYNALVEKAKVRGLDKSQHEGYHESHHIVPKCLGGNNSKNNLVLFTAREHFIAHLILYKAYEDKMAYAFCYISKKGKITNSKIYENAIKCIKSSEIQINNGIKNMTVYYVKDIPEGFVIPFKSNVYNYGPYYYITDPDDGGGVRAGQSGGRPA